MNIAPAFTWKPSADTTFTLLTEYQQSRLPGTAFFFNTPGFRVTRLYGGDAGFNAFTQEQYRIGYAFEHKFSPDLIFRQNFRYYGVSGDFPYTEITGITGLSAQRYAGSTARACNPSPSTTSWRAISPPGRSATR